VGLQRGFVRSLLSVVIVLGIVVAGLLLLEGGGPSPTHPLQMNISSRSTSQPGSLGSEGTGSGGPPNSHGGNPNRNPNRHCKPKPFPHDCRPPSGDRPENMMVKALRIVGEHVPFVGSPSVG
jgi:hypothetical protein